LLGFGADPLVIDEDGTTILHLSSEGFRTPN
jgi:hypothetical protein